VEYASSDLIFVMDSIGRVTVINKDLANEEHGVIFVLKKSTSATRFFLPQIHYPEDEPITD
jgi:hypothetical protein